MFVLNFCNIFNKLLKLCLYLSIFESSHDLPNVGKKGLKGGVHYLEISLTCTSVITFYKLIGPSKMTDDQNSQKNASGLYS